MDAKIKLGYRVSYEAQRRLKTEALRANMTIEGCLDYLMLRGCYPSGEKCRKDSVEK